MLPILAGCAYLLSVVKGEIRYRAARDRVEGCWPVAKGKGDSSRRAFVEYLNTRTITSPAGRSRVDASPTSGFFVSYYAITTMYY